MALFRAIQSDLKLQGFFLVVGATVFFSIKGVMVKVAYQWNVDPLTLMTLRYVFSLPVYLVVLYSVREEFLKKMGNRQDRRHLGLALILGVLGYYCASYFDFLGLQYVTANFERMIIYSYPCMVLVLSLVILKNSVKLVELAALLICYAGIAVVFLHDQATFGVDVNRGVLLVLLSALCFALFMIGGEKAMGALGSNLFTSVAMTAASAAVLLHFFIVYPLSQLAVSGKVLVLSVALAIVSTVLPVYMLTRGIRILGASKASIISIFGPAITPVFSFVVLGELFTVIHALGLAFVMGGIWLLQSKRN